MMTDEEKYQLGEDVTEAAASKQRKGTAVLSVRLSSQELAKLEQAAQASGKTVSQVVREAITSFTPNAVRTTNYGVVISQHGTLVTFGEVSASVPGRAETVRRETPEFTVAR